MVVLMVVEFLDFQVYFASYLQIVGLAQKLWIQDFYWNTN